MRRGTASLPRGDPFGPPPPSANHAVSLLTRVFGAGQCHGRSRVTGPATGRLWGRLWGDLGSQRLIVSPQRRPHRPKSPFERSGTVTPERDRTGLPALPEGPHGSSTKQGFLMFQCGSRIQGITKLVERTELSPVCGLLFFF